MALASSAFGADEVNVTTGAVSAKLGGEFRSELTYDDHGLDKAEGYDPDSTSSISVQAANIKLHGKINNETEFGFRFNLLGTSTPLDYGYGTHWYGKTVGVSFGKMKVLQGGWDNADLSYATHHFTAYRSGLVFEGYKPMIAVNAKVAGDITFQLFDDVTTADQGEWNKTTHPTWALGWAGSFGPIMPLVNLGSYDNNKSRWLDVGVKTEMNGLAASLDFFNRNHVHKYADMADPEKNKEVADVGTGIALNVAYELKGTATPWFHFSTYDVKQGTDDEAAGAPGEDVKVNATCDGDAECMSWAKAMDPASDGNHMFNDNASSWGLGANINMLKNWTPYLAIVSRGGKFLKAGTADEEESKSQMWVRLGVLGEI
jgi:hypothetical protein